VPPGSFVRSPCPPPRAISERAPGNQSRGKNPKVPTGPFYGSSRTIHRTYLRLPAGESEAWRELAHSGERHSGFDRALSLPLGQATTHGVRGACRIRCHPRVSLFISVYLKSLVCWTQLFDCSGLMSPVHLPITPPNHISIMMRCPGSAGTWAWVALNRGKCAKSVALIDFFQQRVSPPTNSGSGCFFDHCWG
jgi:hypothetical protein